MPVPMTPYIQYFDSNGEPRSGGKVYTYAANTTTPKATFTSALGDVQAANPITLNSAGMPDHGSGNVGMIWIQGAYDFVVTNADGTDPITVRNETSFNTIAPAGASFFQTWSGDGTTTTFNTSQPLGTDENAVLLYVDNGLPNFIKNGNFATDTIWTKGAGWVIGSGVATATTASADISQTADGILVPGQSYTITYTITRTAGSIAPNIGGVDGVVRSTAGTFTETIVAGATQLIKFTTVGFTGTLDNVSVTPVVGTGRQVVYPTEFTLNNTSFTLAVAPKTGVNNIAMFAFSTLVAAASASAAAAEAFAQAASISATNASASAMSLTATSTTSRTVNTGVISFVTQTGKNFIAGQPIIAASAGTPSSYMYGTVSSYSSITGDLYINVTDIAGSGTLADWNISVSGIKGASGGSVPDGSVTYPKIASSAIAILSDWAAGTASKLLTAVNFLPAVKAALGFSAFFESAEIAYVAGNSTYSATHGLGAAPKLSRTMIRCKIAEGGYAIGDEIAFEISDNNITFDMASGSNATSCFLSMQGPARLALKNGTGVFVLTAANWRVFFRAWG